MIAILLSTAGFVCLHDAAYRLAKQTDLKAAPLSWIVLIGTTALGSTVGIVCLIARTLIDLYSAIFS